MELRLLWIPLRLGNPLRVPSYSWPAWDITWHNDNEFQELVRLSEREYGTQWRFISPQRYSKIGDAAKSAGLGDPNACLNDHVAKIAAQILMACREDAIRILDIGAGLGTTTRQIWNRLGDSTRDRTFWHLIDPCAGSLEEAGRRLRDESRFPCDRLTMTAKSDLDFLLPFVGSFHLIVAVASLHHHAFLRLVFQAIAKSLRPGGYLIIGDWHNRLSTHPAHILRLLNGIERPNANEDCSRFVRRYPNALIAPNDCNDLVLDRADQQMFKFWTEFAKLHGDPIDSFIVLEGHRPVAKYVEDLLSSGFQLAEPIEELQYDNPLYVIPGSELLSVLVATKP